MATTRSSALSGVDTVQDPVTLKKRGFLKDFAYPGLNLTVSDSYKPEKNMILSNKSCLGSHFSTTYYWFMLVILRTEKRLSFI